MFPDHDFLKTRITNRRSNPNRGHSGIYNLLESGAARSCVRDVRRSRGSSRTSGENDGLAGSARQGPLERCTMGLEID
jgi:hypothetical protein